MYRRCVLLLCLVLPVYACQPLLSPVMSPPRPLGQVTSEMYCGYVWHCQGHIMSYCVCCCHCMSCVWVPPSVSKGFHVHFFPTKQGAHGSVPGVSQRSSRFRLGYRERTLSRRTCLKHSDTTGPPCRCLFAFIVVFTPPPSKQVSADLQQSRSRRAADFCNNCSTCKIT